MEEGGRKEEGRRGEEEGGGGRRRRGRRKEEEEEGEGGKEEGGGGRRRKERGETERKKSGEREAKNKKNNFFSKNKKQIKKEKLLNKKIYETPTYNIKLAYNTDIVFIKEKENIYDNKAIKVKINGIGTVGYVSKKSNQELTDIIDNNEIKEIIATVSGGKYKIFYSIVVNEFVEKYKIKILVKYKRGRLA